MAAKGLVYLDNQATTRCDPRVVEVMLPYFSEHYGNAASNSHSFGWMAEAATTLAREQIAECIGANSNEIVFVSGATEANNLAIKGAAQAYQRRGKHVVVPNTEHASVLDCVSHLQEQGFSSTKVAVNGDGLLSPETLVAALQEDTTVVSMMLVNNEIGVISDITSLAAAVRAYNPRIVIHCDAAQALGKIPIDVKALGVDLLSLSAHKAYGPKGIGALWRRRRPRLVVQAQQHGGGHEWGIRSGTLPVPLIAGFGKACDLVTQQMQEDSARIAELRTFLIQSLKAELPQITVNGSESRRIAGNLNLSIEGVLADTLLSDLSGIALSTGSACSSLSDAPSHVLAAIVSPEMARSSIRVGIGRFTTRDEVRYVSSAIISAVQKLRR